MTLPQDPAMLLSYVNTKLRDQYASLEELCDDLHLDQAELVSKLAASGYEYSKEHNKFW